MPPLKRSSKRAADLHPVMVDAEELFAWGDGTWCMFTGMAEPYENRLLARAAWNAAREATWGLPDRGLWPPGGAVHDGITRHTERCRPASLGVSWSAPAVAEAVAADVASVESFRKADRVAASSIADHLELYVADLGILAAIVERAAVVDIHEHQGDDEHQVAASTSWTALEMRRRR